MNTPESPIRVVIVDDEPPARAALRAALAPHRDLQIVGEAEDGPQAVALLRATRPDLAFLDVRMPGMSGLDVTAALPPRERPFVVFVTAHHDRATDAFRLHAVDYLVKPFDDDRFADMLAHVRARLAESRAGGLEDRLRALLDRPSHATRIRVQEDERTWFVPVKAIRYFEADGNYAVLHAGDTTHRIRDSLAALAERLDPARFVRIHRSTILNIDHLKEVQPWFSGDYVAILHDGTRLRVSRHYRDDLLRHSF